LPPPAAPSNLTASTSFGNVILSWRDNSNNEQGFYIERGESSGNACGTFVQIDQVGSNTTFYVDYSTQNNRTYCYRVRAFNQAGNSAYSNTVTIVAGH
jgi:hypothetical protein